MIYLSFMLISEARSIFFFYGKHWSLKRSAERKGGGSPWHFGTLGCAGTLPRLWFRLGHDAWLDFLLVRLKRDAVLGGELPTNRK